MPSVAGCHTFGPSIAVTTRRIRTALGLFVPEPHLATLQVRLCVPAPLDRLVAAADGGMSRRDVAELLRLSPQRVQQLVDGGGVRPAPR